METNTGRFAERELTILVKASTDPDNRPIIEHFIPEILALTEKFGKSGQSGGSAPFTAIALAKAIKKLCLQKPICPITGIEEEWMDVANLGDGDSDILYQNKRCSALFKNKDGRCWYLDAIAFKTANGDLWSSAFLLNPGLAIKYFSRQYVKSFPFTPKTFYIDVNEGEVAKDDWEFYIKDNSQLEKVFNYYDKYEPA